MNQLVNLVSILDRLSCSLPLSTEQDQWLLNYQCYQSDAFIEQNQSQLYQQKKQLFSQVYPTIESYCQQINFTDQALIKQDLWALWLPLALEIAHQQQQKNSVFVFGILGGQGTGKTTLTQILPLIWRELNLASVAISIDDLYKTYAERQALQKIDPRLIWRGPPATHDVDLGLKTIDALLNQEKQVEIPRFDKSAYQGMGDRTTPQLVKPVDIVMLEGWLVGVEPIAETKFDKPPFPIITEEDRQFAIVNNQRLQAYVPLWQKLDYLLVLNPREYQYSLQWRQQAEHLMISQGKTGMSDQQIEEFVHYFWQALHPDLFIKPLTQKGAKSDLVVNINLNHGIDRIYRP